MPSVAMPNLLLVDWSGVVLEPKLDRVQQPNVVVMGVANRIKQLTANENKNRGS